MWQQLATFSQFNAIKLRMKKEKFEFASSLLHRPSTTHHCIARPPPPQADWLMCQRTRGGKSFIIIFHDLWLNGIFRASVARHLKKIKISLN